MKKSIRMLALVLSFIMVLGLFPAVHAEEAPVLAKADETVVYYTNDVHTYINKTLSYDNLADLKTETEKQAAGVLLVDAGDAIQGTAYGSMDKGKTIIELMNAADYDLATLGNHEFDYGMEGAMNAIEWAEFPYISANFYHEKDGVVGDTVLDAYKVYEIEGLKIAFVGITTPETFTKSTPAYFQDENGNYIYGIAGGTDGAELYAAVQKAVDAASAEADVVIGLAHLGDDPASQPWTSEEVIANTTGLDALIDGHSHSTVPMKEVADKNGDPVILTQTGEYFGAIGKMVISAEGEITTELLTEWTGSDETVKAIKDEWMAEINEQLGEVIGYSEVDLVIKDENGRQIRSREMNLGDFCADALYYLFDSMDLDVDVAIMNGGGIRADAPAGELSYNTCKTVHTFGNVACLQTITGQQLLDALEWGAKNVGTGENGGFLQVSGITYEIHSYIPSTVQADEKGVWIGGPTGAYRVQNVRILQDGEYVDLDLNASYNLAGYNYTLRDLGDGFAMFDGAVNVLDYVMEDYLVLSNYVKSFPVDETTGLPTIGADSIYNDIYGAGRIDIVTESPNANDVVVYYTNDVHTYIDGEISYDNLAWLKQNTYAAGVLLVDAGDHAQGTAYGSMDNGKTIIELMNAAGYDLATLGNHEFDYGMDGTMNIIDWAEFPYVSANFYHENPLNPGAGGFNEEEEAWEIQDPVLEPFWEFEVGGKKIAIIGITTPESFTKSTPAYFQNEKGEYIYGIAGGTDGQALYDYVQLAINAAKLGNPDVIIALGHLGDDKASQPWTSEELIANTTGLDAFIDGHSHSTVPMKEVADKDGNAVILTQTGEYFGAIGKMVISADGSIETELVDWAHGSDAAVKAIKDEWITEIDTKLGEVIGHLDVTLDNYDANGGRLVRKQETNTGAFAADALYYLFDNMGLDVDVAIMNGGGVRSKAVTGDFSYKTAKEIHTFGNVACLQTITGQQLLDALEWGAKDAPDKENGGFLHVSGITYVIDTSIPSTVRKDEKGVWIGGPTGEYRVKNVQILQDGEYVDLDLNAKYNLAGYNYTLRDLGDGFAMFDGAVNVLDYVMEDYMVLANYIKSFPVDETTGLPTVTAENSPYGDVDYVGRIRQVGAFTDVPADSYYHAPSRWALYEGITAGTGEDTFGPAGELYRAQYVTMLWSAAGKPIVDIENPFTDVKEGDYFYNAVLWAYSEGITSGVSATTFGPGLTIARAQAIAMLYASMGKPEIGVGGETFSDVDPDAYYAAAVVWADVNGIAKGIGGGLFGVAMPCNRAHAVTFLYKALAD